MDGCIEYIKDKLKDNFDVKYREIEKSFGKTYIIFIDNLVDTKFISENIVAPLVLTDMGRDIESVKNNVLAAYDIGDVKKCKDAILHILSGDVVLVFEHIDDMLYCQARGFAKRSITVPQTDAVIKGPREGFTEVIVDNISLIRRKVKNENLKMEIIYVGKKSNTAVAVSYISGTAPDSLVQLVKNKIQSMNIDFVLDSNYIEEELKDRNSPFDTIGYTEKPDIAASKLFEGKIIVIVDGTPQVVIAPYFFVEQLQAPDDYYLNKWFTNISRLTRWIAFFIATLLNGLYIALSTHHFSLIPTVFVFKLANTRAGVPFPTVVEVVLMSVFFVILREAGIRLPQPTGQTMSIVGALILGDAAVGAGLASESTVVVVALSSICTFLIPKLYKPIIIWNMIIISFSSLLGLPGFYLGFLVMISHLAGLNSCGYPYLFPFGTLKNYKSKDFLVRQELNNITNNSILDEDE